MAAGIRASQHAYMASMLRTCTQVPAHMHISLYLLCRLILCWICGSNAAESVGADARWSTAVACCHCCWLGYHCNGFCSDANKVGGNNSSRAQQHDEAPRGIEGGPALLAWWVDAEQPPGHVVVHAMQPPQHILCTHLAAAMASAAAAAATRYTGVNSGRCVCCWESLRVAHSQVLANYCRRCYYCCCRRCHHVAFILLQCVRPNH